MTQVTVTMQTTHSGHIEITGHAGDPLVCAGISTLVCAALNAMGDAAQNVVYESGDVRFDAEITDGVQMGALETLIGGLEIMGDKFPGRVGVTLNCPDDLQY